MRLAAVVDHATRRARDFRTLKSTLGRSERDMSVVLRRKLAAEIDAGNVRSAAMAALIGSSATWTREFGRLTRRPRPGCHKGSTSRAFAESDGYDVA